MTTDQQALAIFEELEGLQDEILRLRKALNWLLHETMYKDHPDASQNAIDVLGEHLTTYRSDK